MFDKHSLKRHKNNYMPKLKQISSLDTLGLHYFFPKSI